MSNQESLPMTCTGTGKLHRYHPAYVLLRELVLTEGSMFIEEEFFEDVSRLSGWDHVYVVEFRSNTEGRWYMAAKTLLTPQQIKSHGTPFLGTLEQNV